MQGTALHSHTHTILQPLFRLRLETWADFSTRLPAQQVGPAQLGALTRMSSGWEWVGSWTRMNRLAGQAACALLHCIGQPG